MIKVPLSPVVAMIRVPFITYGCHLIKVSLSPMVVVPLHMTLAVGAMLNTNTTINGCHLIKVPYHLWLSFNKSAFITYCCHLIKVALSPMVVIL